MTASDPGALEPGLPEWLAAAGFPIDETEKLAGDVSPRQYTRLRLAKGAGSAILATYPPEVRDTCARFLATTGLLDEAGVRVPRVLAADCERGWMLLEDLGPQTLGERKGEPWRRLIPYFEHALELGRRISRLPADVVDGLNPRLGRELLSRELKQTWDLFLEPQGLVADSRLAGALHAALEEVCDRLAAEPPVPCHRDFMARNLIPLSAGGEVAVLDHQDLRLGPPAYDLASLLNDTLFPPPEVEESLLAAGPADRLSYHRAAAQRTIKAVGTYASFARRGAERHLPLIAPTLARGVEHLSRVPEGAAVAGELARAWQAVLEPVAG